MTHVHCALQRETVPEGGGKLNYVPPSGKAPTELPANLWGNQREGKESGAPAPHADMGLVIGTLLPANTGLTIEGEDGQPAWVGQRSGGPAVPRKRTAGELEEDAAEAEAKELNLDFELRRNEQVSEEEAKTAKRAAKRAKKKANKKKGKTGGCSAAAEAVVEEAVAPSEPAGPNAIVE